MTKKISDKDKKDWDTFINNDEKVFDKEIKTHKTFIEKTKLIDLHGYTLDQANIKIEEFVLLAYKEKIKGRLT